MIYRSLALTVISKVATHPEHICETHENRGKLFKYMRIVWKMPSSGAAKSPQVFGQNIESLFHSLLNVVSLNVDVIHLTSAASCNPAEADSVLSLFRVPMAEQLQVLQVPHQ